MSALILKVFVLWLLHREVSWRVWDGYAGRVGGTGAPLGPSRAGPAAVLLAGVSAFYLHKRRLSYVSLGPSTSQSTLHWQAYSKGLLIDSQK